MSSYWIQDSQGLVLGPVGIDVLKDLATAKRLADFLRVSKDGTTWKPVAQVPEVARVFSPGASERAEREAVQAQRVRMELERLKALPTHALFGVVHTAPLAIFRQGFLALAKPYHPARLSRDVHPELLRAHMEMFQYLSGRMVEHERGTSRPVPAQRATPPTLPPPAPKDDAIQLVKHAPDGRLEVRVDLDFGNAFMLTGHKLVNYSMGGLFLPCERLAPLGTYLDVHLRFLTPTRQIQSRGSVVWENLLNAAYPKGFGVRLEKLKAEDHAFVRGFIDRYQATKSKRS
ncbi:MAG: PilZ domain-containing protein [Myxococcaceae bacterium]